MKYIVPIVLSLFLAGCYQGDTADLIIHNAQIYSCDEDFGIYEAMAIRDGKVIQLGPEREILNGYDCDQIVDAQTRPVFPGFHDGHCHFTGFANSLNEADLTGSHSYDEVLDRLERYAETCETDWIRGRGWDQTLWGVDSFPTNTRLNDLFPDRPVLIRRIDGHAALANATALNLAGFTTDTKIEGGMIGVKNGQLTGLLLDNAYDSVAQHIPPLTDDQQLTYLQDAQYLLFQEGLTSINDAGIEASERQRFIDWYEQGLLLIKNYSMLYPDVDNMRFATEEGIYKKGNLHIGSFKVIADGALGSWGASLIEPYADDHANHGLQLRTVEELKEVTALAAEIGYQVNTHCIGDSANRVLLNIYAETVQQNPDHRWKIEHAQVVHPDDFDYFQSVRILPSVQPTHCTSDMDWAEKRLGSERIKGAYAYKTLLNKAGKIVLGTDFPIEGISPLATFYAAITRMDADGHPAGGFYAEEALTREEALKGMTIWPAYSNFEEDEKGSLEPGKAADFVILTKDIMTIAPQEILNTFVVKTFVDGKMVYDGE